MQQSDADSSSELDSAVRGAAAGGGLPSAEFASLRLWSRGADTGPSNALTCDVEDYFHVSAFADVLPQDRWDKMDCRLPANIDRVLQLFSDAKATGTFFTLGWVAQRLPEVVRRIADAGHEIASHGMRHVRVWAQEPEDFRQDAAAAKRLLEDVTGRAVRGYRAASWSIDERTPWAHSILSDVGYEYSSSMYPIKHDHYGTPDAPRTPFFPSAADILEIPASTVRFAGRNWPAAGGGYFRLLPLPVSLWLLRRVARAQDAPAVFYFHPWELDTRQPRIAGADRRMQFRHYLNLHKFEKRLKAVLESFEWRRMDEIFCGVGGESDRP